MQKVRLFIACLDIIMAIVILFNGIYFVIPCIEQNMGIKEHHISSDALFIWSSLIVLSILVFLLGFGILGLKKWARAIHKILTPVFILYGLWGIFIYLFLTSYGKAMEEASQNPAPLNLWFISSLLILPLLCIAISAAEIKLSFMEKKLK